MAQLSLSPGNYLVPFIGPVAVRLDAQPWFTAANVDVYAVSANRAGYTKNAGGSNQQFASFTTFQPSTPTSSPNAYILVAKTTFSIDGTLFGTPVVVPQPTITALSTSNIQAGGTLTVTGTNLTPLSYVLIGVGLTVIAAAITGTPTSTSATVTVPAVLPSGNAAVVAITPGGPSQPFSNLTVTATATGGGSTANVVLLLGQSNDSGLSPRSGLDNKYYNTDPRIRSWDKTTGRADTYSLGTTNSDGTISGANDHAITKALYRALPAGQQPNPEYDNGFGADVAFAYAWAQDAANAGKELFFFKLDLTPPQSSNAKSINAWLNGGDGAPALYPECLSEWQAFSSYLSQQGYTTINRTLFCGIGEQDSTNYLTSSTGGTNPDFAGSLTTFLNKFRSDGILSSSSPVVLVQKHRPGNLDAVIAAAQADYVRANSSNTRLLQPGYDFLSRDNTHLTQASMLALGPLEYQAYKGSVPAVTPQPLITSTSGAIAAGNSYTITGTGFTNPTAVYFGTTPISVSPTSQSDTQLVVTVPSNPGNTVKVVTYGGKSNVYTPGGAGADPSGQPTTMVQRFAATDWSYDSQWTRYDNDASSLSGTIYYTDTSGVATLSVAIPTGGGVLRFYSNRAPGYGNIHVRAGSTDLGVFSAVGASAPADAVNYLYQTIRLAAGTYLITQTSEPLPNRTTVVVDRMEVWT